MRWRLGSIVAVARRWWPVPAILGSSLVIQKVFFESRYDVAGHPGGHLGSATAPFSATAADAVPIMPIACFASPSPLSSSVRRRSAPDVDRALGRRTARDRRPRLLFVGYAVPFASLY